MNPPHKKFGTWFLSFKLDHIEITKPGDEYRTYKPGRVEWYLFGYIPIPYFIARLILPV